MKTNTHYAIQCLNANDGKTLQLPDLFTDKLTALRLLHNWRLQVFLQSKNSEKYDWITQDNKVIFSGKQEHFSPITINAVDEHSQDSLRYEDWIYSVIPVVTPSDELDILVLPLNGGKHISQFSMPYMGMVALTEENIRLLQKLNEAVTKANEIQPGTHVSIFSAMYEQLEPSDFEYLTGLPIPQEGTYQVSALKYLERIKEKECYNHQIKCYNDEIMFTMRTGDGLANEFWMNISWNKLESYLRELNNR